MYEGPVRAMSPIRTTFLHNAKVHGAVGEHVDNGAAVAFGPALQAAIHATPPMLVPATSLVTWRQRGSLRVGLALLGHRDGTPLLLLRLELVPFGGRPPRVRRLSVAFLRFLPLAREARGLTRVVGLQTKQSRSDRDSIAFALGNVN